MDPEATIELLRYGYDAWNRGDLDGMLENYHEDTVFRTSGLYPGIEPVYRGHAGWRAFWSDFMADYEEFKIQPERYEFMERDGVWIVPVHIRGRPRGSAGELELPGVHAIVIRDGLVIWFGAFESEEEALEAAREAPR